MRKMRKMRYWAQLIFFARKIRKFAPTRKPIVLETLNLTLFNIIRKFSQVKDRPGSLFPTWNFEQPRTNILSQNLEKVQGGNLKTLSRCPHPLPAFNPAQGRAQDFSQGARFFRYKKCIK